MIGNANLEGEEDRIPGPIEKWDKVIGDRPLLPRTDKGFYEYMSHLFLRASIKYMALCSL